MKMGLVRVWEREGERERGNVIVGESNKKVEIFFE